MVETNGYLPPSLESYSVEVPQVFHALDVETVAAPVQEWKITLRGRNFFERAMMPIIRMGNIRVQKYEISPDGSAIVCYLPDLPDEGSEISITYGAGMTATLSQRFSRSQLGGVARESPETKNGSEE